MASIHGSNIDIIVATDVVQRLAPSTAAERRASSNPEWHHRGTDRTSPVAPDVVSTHRTSEGILTWTRDADGTLQARLLPHGALVDRLVAEGRPRAGGIN